MRRKKPRRPAPCASCGTETDEWIPHKDLRDGIVVREKLCPDCYLHALKAAIGREDFVWARLNDEVRTLSDTIKATRAQERQSAWRADKATPRQLDFVKSLAEARDHTIENAEDLTKGEASDLIDELQSRPVPKRCATCSERFVAENTMGGRSRKHCDTCQQLTPAQRRKLVGKTTATVH